MPTSISGSSDSGTPGTPGSSPANPMTVSDTATPIGANPLDAKLPGTDKTPSLNKPWPGPTADSGSVNGIKAVTASVGGPNVLVATDGNGKLPSSILPPTGYSGPTVQVDVTGSRVSGTIYHNTSGVPLYLNITTSNTGTSNIISDSNASPTLVIATTSNSGGAPDATELSGIVLTGNYYKANGTINLWVETH